MSSTSDDSFRIPVPDGSAITAEIRRRIAERNASGLLSEEEIARVAAARPRIAPIPAGAAEAFRRACVTWEVGRPPRISSHRPVLGVVLVAWKRILYRVLRFLVEQPLARQSEFNRSVLVALTELADRRNEHERDDP